MISYKEYLDAVKYKEDCERSDNKSLRYANSLYFNACDLIAGYLEQERAKFQIEANRKSKKTIIR